MSLVTSALSRVGSLLGGPILLAVIILFLGIYVVKPLLTMLAAVVVLAVLIAVISYLFR